MELVPPVIVAKDMPGVRIRGRGNAQDYTGSEHYFRIDYRFVDLINPIRPLIGDLYWLTDDVIYSDDHDGRLEDQSALDSLSLWSLEESGSLQLYAPEFLPQFAKYIGGDWTDIFGITAPIDPSTIRYVPKSHVPDCCVVYFSCIDAAYWEVYSSRSEILDVLRAVFPFNDYCTLKDKRN